MVDAVQLAAREAAEVRGRQRRRQLGDVDLAAKLRPLRVERFEQTLGDVPLVRVVVGAAVAPARPLPALGPLPARHGDEVDGGAARVALREVGILGGGKGRVHYGERRLRILCVAAHVVVVLLVRVEPEVGAGEPELLVGVLEAEFKPDTR